MQSGNAAYCLDNVFGDINFEPAIISVFYIMCNYIIVQFVSYFALFIDNDNIDNAL